MILMRDSEELEPGEHARESMLPLLQDYGKETSFMIYVLNDPKKPTYWIPDKIRCVLKRRGCRRVFLRYLISARGYFEKTGHNPEEKLFLPFSDSFFSNSLQQVSKIFFAFGNPPDDLKEFINLRVAEERQRILSFMPDTEFYCFGELTTEGYPKSLDDITHEDAENTYNPW